MADAKNKAAQQAIEAHIKVQATVQPALTGGWLYTLFLTLILPILDSLLTLAAPTIQANPKLKAICVAADRELDIILGDAPGAAKAAAVAKPAKDVSKFTIG